MTATQRLEAIRQRAKALGWTIWNLGDEKGDVLYLGFDDSTFIVKGTKASVQAAERLLSLHEPGVTVKVHSDCYKCDMLNAGVSIDEDGEIDYRENWEPYCIMGHSIENDDMDLIPGPLCKPGTHKLIPWEDGDGQV